MKQLVLLNTLLILLFVAFAVQAQEFNGFSEWEKGDMATAKKEFETLYNSKKTKLVGAYGLGLVYSDERYPERDMKLAYDYASESRTLYRELKSKQKENLTAKKFKYSRIKGLRDQILTIAITDAQNKNTAESFDYIIQNFKLTLEDKKEIYGLRNGAALKTAKSLNSYSDYAKIYETYERKTFTRYTPDLADEVDLRLFEAFVKEEGYENLDKFKEAYPKSPFASSGSTVDKFIAATKEDSAEAFEKFADQNPSSSLARIARKKIKLMRGETTTVATPSASDLKVEPRPISAINSPADEHMLCLTADNKTMYFAGTSRRDGLGEDDVFMSKFANGKWSKPKLIKSICSPDYSEVPLSVSADGTRLILFEPVYNEKTDETKGMITYTDKTSKGWSKTKPFPYPFNTNYRQAGAQMTADGKGMILTIQKKEGDDFDIYYVAKDGDKWGAIVNLGRNVNTPSNERTPFLHPDMRTLYFSSDGRGGYGNMDVFMTTRKGDSWTSWTRPVNLGKDINTAGIDWGYKITTDGKRAFFASGSQKQDFYEIDLPERFRPNAVNLITSTVDVTDNKDKKIVVENAETGEVIGEFQADPQTGEVVAVLPEGVKTKVRVEGEGLVSRPIEIEAKSPKNETKNGTKADTDKATDSSTSTTTSPATETNNMTTTAVNLNAVDLEVAIAEGQTYSFPDLLFDYDSDRVNAPFYGELDKIAAALQESSTFITVAGHTDDQGSNDYNNDLSQRRAEAVKTYLVGKGIDPSKVQAIGYGESQPVADNSSSEGQAQNRRVEIIFKRP